MNPYSMETFVQPSLRRKGIYSPIFMERACAVLGATSREIRSQKNNRDASKRRYAIAYVLKHARGREASEIGNMLHMHVRTVGHGLERAASLLKTDPEFSEMVDALEMVA